MNQLRRRIQTAAMSGGEAAPPPFSPLDIAGLKVWLDASQITGLNDGDSVTTWSDLSGQGNDVTQSTASKKPTYQTNEINGLPVVKFDGVDDASLFAGAVDMTSTYTFFTVIRKPAGYAYVVDGAGGGLDLVWNFIPYGSQNKKYFISSNGEDIETGTSVKTTATCVIWQPSTSILKVDGSNVAFSRTGYTGSNLRYGIGARSTIFFGTQDIAELFYTTNAVSVDTILKAQAYLISKWGIVP